MNSLPPWIEPRTAYIHVPFCGHHCGYCDFAVTAGHDHLIEPYLDALLKEFERLEKPRAIESLFIGGGTPTYLSIPQLERLLNGIDNWLPLKSDCRVEFTIESTPESLDHDKVKLLAAHGVNRVSVGVQSFRSEMLQALDRRHGVEQIPRAVDAVRKYVPSLSFDLIFAAPGQTLEAWDFDLRSALNYKPEHISTYGLTYEKGTPLWKDRERGRIVPVPEDLELELYLHGIDLLSAEGFEHYEISNFARPGHRSIHNQRYWANEAYFGFGVGAARYIHGRRELNVRDTRTYIARIEAGESPTFQAEELVPRDRAIETAACQLRRIAGIEKTAFTKQTGFDLFELFGSRIEGLIAVELLQLDGDSVRLTRRGICVADGVIADLMRC